VRCNPQDVLVSIQILNDRQCQAIAQRGFSSILDMRVDALGSRSHLAWLMEKLDHNDMTIRAGPGKDLKITKETVHLILGLPNAGGGTALGIDEVVAANNLRAELGLSKENFGVAALQDRLRKGSDDDLSIRSFFLILFNRLLFPTASWGITNHEILLTEEMDRFHQMDWCQLIFNDLCQAAKKWHTRSVTNVSTTIYGCSIVILISMSFFCLLYVAIFFMQNSYTRRLCFVMSHNDSCYDFCRCIIWIIFMTQLHLRINVEHHASNILIGILFKH
jgi:hypothetical protein